MPARRPPAAAPTRIASATRPPRARQQRGVRTEEAILEATIRMLAARGIQGTSLDLLADEVGVAKSSILWHFGSKEELLLRVAERIFEEVARGPVQDILALPTLAQRAEASWRFFLHTVRERPELRRLVPYLVFESAERPELRARLQHLYAEIRAVYEQGLRSVVPDDAQRRRRAIMSVAVFDGIFLQWLLDPDAIDLDALHDEVSRFDQRAPGLPAMPRAREKGSPDAPRPR